MEDTVVVRFEDIAQNSPKEDVQPQKPRQRRDKYVKSACSNCQSRKVRCPGGPTCAQCYRSGLVCEYRGRRKRRTTTEKGTPIIVEQTSDPTPTVLDAQNNLITTSHMVNRIKELEKQFSMLQEQVLASSDQGSATSPLASRDGHSDSATDSTPVTSCESETFRGRTSHLEGLGVLDSNIATSATVDSSCQVESPLASRASSPAPVHWQDSSREVEYKIEKLASDTKALDHSEILQIVDIYFTQINSATCPCVNEYSFRSQLQDFLNDSNFLDAHYTHQLSLADRQQFVALLNFILAEVAAYTSDWTTSSRAPGWDAFCRAENIMARFTWMAMGDLMTLQCLIIRGRYLLVIEKVNAAYDAVGVLVHLCWRLGLYCQRSWPTLNSFETLMRQRLFWAAFDMDRIISLQAGAPYHIRTSDVRVDFPADIDDTQVTPDLVLPQGIKPDPYHMMTGKFGALASDIWDSIYGANARLLDSDEFIAVTEAKIELILKDCPKELRWEQVGREVSVTGVKSELLERRALILRYRANSMRILLRQNILLSLNFEPQIAQEAVPIAAETIDLADISTNGYQTKLVDRFAATMFTTGALLQLMCIIVNVDTEHNLRGDAVKAFEKGLVMMERIAPTFSAARHTLCHLDRMIRITRRAICNHQSFELIPLDTLEFDAEDLVSHLPEAFLPQQPSYAHCDMLHQDFDMLPPLGSESFYDTPLVL